MAVAAVVLASVLHAFVNELVFYVIVPRWGKCTFNSFEASDGPPSKRGAAAAKANG